RRPEGALPRTRAGGRRLDAGVQARAVRRRGDDRAVRGLRTPGRGRALWAHLPRGGALRTVVPRALPHVVRDRRPRAHRRGLGGVPGPLRYTVPSPGAVR